VRFKGSLIKVSIGAFSPVRCPRKKHHDSHKYQQSTLGREPKRYWPARNLHLQIAGKEDKTKRRNKPNGQQPCVQGPSALRLLHRL
jgi:hypothetical protein